MDKGGCAGARTLAMGNAVCRCLAWREHGQLIKLDGVGQATAIAPVSVRGSLAGFCQPEIRETHGPSVAANSTQNMLAELSPRGPWDIWYRVRTPSNAFEEQHRSFGSRTEKRPRLEKKCIDAVRSDRFWSLASQVRNRLPRS